MILRTVLVSFVFAAAGAMCAGAVVGLAPQSDSDWSWLILAAAAGSFFTAVPVWRLIVRPGLEGFWRGLIAGGVIGLLSHPATWCLFIWFYVPTHSRESDEPIPFYAAPIVSLMFSFWSLLIIGWLSFPLAATIGGVMGLAARARSEQTRETP